MEMRRKYKSAGYYIFLKKSEHGDIFLFVIKKIVDHSWTVKTLTLLEQCMVPENVSDKKRNKNIPILQRAINQQPGITHSIYVEQFDSELEQSYLTLIKQISDSREIYVASRYELQEAQQVSRNRFIDDLNNDILEDHCEWEQDIGDWEDEKD